MYEFDIAGFIVARNTIPFPPFSNISGFIPVEGSSVVGAQFSFVDNEISTGITYYYILKVVNSSGYITYEDSISVYAGDRQIFLPYVTIQ
jgi:hypothetical protein